jgi:hypothetical protein
MRSLGIRRAALATGVAAVAAVALVGCSAGQVAETALKKPSVMGANAENSDRSVFIRNLAVQYDGPTGYAAGDNAPLQVSLFNKTKQAITVLVSSQPVTGAPEKAGIVSARSVGLTGGSSVAPSASATATPEPSPSAGESPSTEPSAQPSASSAAVRPARIEIGPMGTVTFLPEDAERLQAVGLTGKLLPGQSVNLVFEFSNGADPLVVQAPVAIPVSPASRAPGIPHEATEE